MKAALLIMFLCISPAVSAAIYKCTDNGSTVYSERPCAHDSGTLIDKRVSVSDKSANTITLNRDRTGRFSLPGTVDGVSTTFTVDTGANMTVISGDIAKQLGIEKCTVVGTSHTANGTAQVCQVKVNTLSIGNFNYTNVMLVLSPAMQGGALLGSDILSGMHIEQNGDIMTISK